MISRKVQLGSVGVGRNTFKGYIIGDGPPLVLLQVTDTMGAEENFSQSRAGLTVEEAERLIRSIQEQIEHIKVAQRLEEITPTAEEWKEMAADSQMPEELVGVEEDKPW